METKRVEVQLDVSHDPNLQWRKLWDILLRPPQNESGLENKGQTSAEKHSADILPGKAIQQYKPQQLSLFPLDKSEPERDDPGMR